MTGARCGNRSKSASAYRCGCGQWFRRSLRRWTRDGPRGCAGIGRPTLGRQRCRPWPETWEGPSARDLL